MAITKHAFERMKERLNLDDYAAYARVSEVIKATPVETLVLGGKIEHDGVTFVIEQGKIITVYPSNK